MADRYDFHEVSYVKRVRMALAVVLAGVSHMQKEGEVVDPEVWEVDHDHTVPS